jgi:hypothetical protein
MSTGGREILPLSLSSELLEETTMGRGILLWLLGVPIPIIIILALIWH